MIRATLVMVTLLSGCTLIVGTDTRVVGDGGVKDARGKIDDLLPLWLDAGVNCMFPIEIGTWGADPVNCAKKLRTRSRWSMNAWVSRSLAVE